MCNFPDTFFRGCPHRNFIKPSAKPFPASPKAFQPNSRAENQNNQAETSIVWNDDAESLPFFIRMETHKEDDGLIKYGIIPVDFIKAESSIRESAFASRISFNHDSDAQNQNPYHGNICFDLSFFFTIDEENNKIPDRGLLDEACKHFVNSQRCFIAPDRFKDFLS